MSPYTPAGFAALVGALPAVGTVEQWDSLVAKVGGKVFALVGHDASGEGPLAFRVAETSFEILTGTPGIGQAPYFAKRRWVSVAPGALEAEAVAAYLAEAHRLVAAGLTRKAQRELGLEAYLASGPGRTA